MRVQVVDVFNLLLLNCRMGRFHVIYDIVFLICLLLVSWLVFDGLICISLSVLKIVRYLVVNRLKNFALYFIG